MADQDLDAVSHPGEPTIGEKGEKLTKDLSYHRRLTEFKKFGDCGNGRGIEGTQLGSLASSSDTYTGTREEKSEKGTPYT